MKPAGPLLFVAMLALGLAGGCAHYASAPLAPQETQREIESRTLADSGLRDFIANNAPDLAKGSARSSWDLAALTLAAWYYHPSLDVARANVAVTEAALVTAGARPNPSLTVAPEYTGNAATATSPWILGLSFDLPIETAGKRGYRVAQAKAVSASARLQLAEAAWAVRSRLRTALLDTMMAQREIDLLQREIDARAEVVRRMEQRFSAGDVSRTEVDAARTLLVQARIGQQSALGRRQESRANLASAVGLPVAALEGVTIEWPDVETLPAAQAVAATAVQTAGLLNRLDVRRALSDYDAVERALQLEITKQYPDVHLLPGYTFDQGDHKFAFGFGVELPLLNKNEGPIAEAKARRDKAAAEVLALQAKVIGELARARAQYESALGELSEVDGALTELQVRTEKLTRRAVELGETDRLALASARLQGLVVARARLDALRRAQNALGALEDAVQRPLAPAVAVPEAPPAPRRPTKNSR